MPIKRPYTPDELNRLEAAGYNTSNYKGELIEFPDKPKESTAAGAGFRAALAGLIPSTATVAAGAAGAKGGAALGALTGNPLGVAAGGLIGMVGGGMAGGMAATKLQEAALPDAAVSRLALDAQEHPTAVRGGQLASLLPTIAVSPTTLVRAGGAIPQLGASAAGRTVANKVGMDALKNVGLGVGINTALEGGRQALAGEFDAGALAAEAAIGAAFNKPTKLGNWAMRTKQTGERVVDNPDALMATIAKIQPTPEEVAKLKEVNEAKKNEVNALKEIQKAQKLKEQEEATKRKMAGLEPLKVKKPGEPIKTPEAAKPAPPSEPPPAAEPPAAPAPTAPVAPVVAPTATPPVAPKPVAPVVAKPKAAPKPKPAPAPVAPKVETPVEVVGELSPLDAHKEQLRAMAVANSKNLLDLSLANKVKELGGDPTDFKILSDPKTPEAVWNKTAERLFSNKTAKPTNVGDAIQAALDAATPKTTPVVEAPKGPTPEQKMHLDAKGVLPQLYEDATQEQIAKWLAPTPVVSRPSVSSTAPVVAEPKTKSKTTPNEFYAAKRKEHAAPIERITEAWHDAMDSGDNKPLEAAIAEYGGKGADILQIGGLKPESNEFVAAVMRLRGDKSKPGKAAPKIKAAVVEKPVEKPIEPAEPTAEQLAAERNRKIADELGVPEELNQDKSPVQTPLGKEVSDALAAKKKSTKPTTAYRKAVDEIDRGLPPVVEDSKLDAKGSFNTKTGQRTINPDAETLDTRPHETAHDLVRTIYEAKSKGSRRADDYITKLERTQQEGLDAYNAERKTKGLKPVDHEEFATLQQGQEFLKQQLNLKKETGWKKWVNDTKALFNTTYGKNPTMEELRRVLNFRFVNENVAPRTFPKAAPIAAAVPFKLEGIDDNGIIKTPKLDNNIEQQQWRLKNNRQASGENAQEYILPEGITYNKLNNIWQNADNNIQQKLYDEIVRLNPELKTINISASPKGIQNVLGGVASKYKADNIKYFIEDLNGNASSSPDTQFTYNENRQAAQATRPSQSSFKDAAERDAAIRGVKTAEEAKAVIEKLKAEREVLAKEGLAATMDSEARHKVASKMMANKMDIQQLAEKHKVESGEIKYQENEEGLPLTNRESDVLPPDPTRQSFFRKMAATYDRVDEVNPTIGQAARDYENRKSGYQGMANAALVDLSKYKTADINRVVAEHRKAYRTDEAPDLSGPNDEAISAILSDYYGKIADIRRESGLLVGGRTGGKDQFYVPDMMNAQTADIFTRDPLSMEAAQLKEDWATHILSHERAEGMTREEVMRNINEYIGAMGGKSNNYKSLEFGAIRKASGYGLPEHMRELDGAGALARYSRRAASDLAFFQEIQSKPEIAGPLHIKDQKGDVPTEYAESAYFQDKRIKDMMKWITNDINGVQHNSPVLRSTVRLINNALLGPATGIRDLMSVPVNALPYINKFSDLGAAWKGMMDIRKNSRAALETGARQPHIDKVAFDDLLQSPNRFADALGTVADGLRKWQGREAMENIARDLTFSVGKELGRSNIIGAKAGHNQSKLWLKKFGDLVDGDILALEGDALETALNQIGKNFTDRNQGTYGGRGLPIGMVDSQFAPFLTLQKWSVEKANVIYKDVYKPFMTGENRLPMLTYTLGSFLTGAAIQQVNQLMTGKKGIDPTIKEALDKGDPAAIAQEVAVIMQLAAHAGIMSDMVKLAADTGIRGRVPRNIVSFPTATAAVRTTEAVTDMAEALRQGEDPWQVLKAFTLDLMTTNIQAMRMLANHTVNDEEADRKDKFRDVRVYNELEGKPAGVIAKTNPYMGLDAKKFKKTVDVGEAQRLAPELVRKAAEKSGGSVESFRKSLSSLKGNSYQTMPSPKESPEEFKKYYDFLVRTQGVDEANARVTDYVMQTQINKAKSSLIP